MLFPFRHGTNYTDWCYAGGTIAAVLTSAYLILRQIGRLASARRGEATVDLNRRSAVAVIAVTVAAVAGWIGRPYRIARHWVVGLLRDHDAGILPKWDGVTAPPLPLSPADRLTVLRTAVTQLPTPRERLAALKLMIEAFPSDGPAVLPNALAVESDPEVLATELRLLGLYRDPAHVPTLMKYFDDPDPQVRAAATDAIGLIHLPAFNLNEGDDPVRGLGTNPPIDVSDWTPFREWFYGTSARVPVPLPEDVRSKVLNRLLTSAILTDREAAAERPTAFSITTGPRPISRRTRLPSSGPPPRFKLTSSTNLLTRKCCCLSARRISTPPRVHLMIRPNKVCPSHC